jgi:hypothetical protein
MPLSPASQRIAAAPSDGVLAPAGVATFRRRYLEPNTMERFHDWANQEETKLAVKAIQDLALNGPVGMNQQPEGYAVQYGMTIGLQLAAQILIDPSVIFPEVFRGGVRAPVPTPTPDYESRPEDAQF